MDTEYSFRTFGEDDIAQVITVVNGALGCKAEPGWLKWKLLPDPPAGILSSVAVLNGRIVGLSGNVEVPFRVSGKDERAALGVDLAISSEHRRMDTFLGIMNCAADGFGRNGILFAYGFPNDEARMLNETMLGFTTVAPLPVLVKIVRPLRWLAVKLRLGLPADTGRYGLPADTARQDGVLSDSGRFRICRGVRFDERFDSLWERMKSDYRVMSVRNARHLNRRYAEVPGRPYETAAVESVDGAELHGYAVYAVLRLRNGECRGRILDLMTARSGPPEAADCLVRYVCRRLAGLGADAIDCWMFPHSHLHERLRAGGFFSRAKQDRVLQVRVLRQGEARAGRETIEQAGNWHICMGDGDFA